MFDDENNLKNRSTFRDYYALAGYLDRKYKNPTEEQMQEIENAMRNSLTYLKLWKIDRETYGWVKYIETIPLNQTKIDEQKKFIAETSVPLDDE